MYFASSGAIVVAMNEAASLSEGRTHGKPFVAQSRAKYGISLRKSLDGASVTENPDAWQNITKAALCASLNVAPS
jgi:hypothetical protein